MVQYQSHPVRWSSNDDGGPLIVAPRVFGMPAMSARETGAKNLDWIGSTQLGQSIQIQSFLIISVGQSETTTTSSPVENRMQPSESEANCVFVQRAKEK